MVLEWIEQGHTYSNYYIGPGEPPDHPRLPARRARSLCLTEFPSGILPSEVSYSFGWHIGDGPGELLPGLYEYRREGDKRVEGEKCRLTLASKILGASDDDLVSMPYGEPFTFHFYSYHERVVPYFGFECEGALYRVGD